MTKKEKTKRVLDKKASEIFEALLCNPDGDIVIIASSYDKKLLKAGIEKVKELEWSEKFHREAAEALQSASLEQKRIAKNERKII